MLLKTSCKTIIFLLKKLKICKKIKKLNFKPLTCLPLFLSLTSAVDQHLNYGNLFKSPFYYYKETLFLSI